MAYRATGIRKINPGYYDLFLFPFGIPQEFIERERMFKTPRHFRKEPLLDCVVYEFAGNHVLFKSYRDYREKDFSHSVCSRNWPELCGQVYSVRLGY